MSCSLPPEIFDNIIDHLHDDLITLKACCLVSKSWVPRTRQHLFARIEFNVAGRSIHSWMHTFTDPSSSPGQHARDLHISGLEPLTAASTWVRSFCHIERLLVRTYHWERHPEAALVQLHGLSDTLRSLYLSHVSLPLSKVFDLVCSFPLLENLALHHESREIDTDGWVTPLTSPKLTGSLHSIDEIRSARVLLDLPGGIRFTKITIRCFVEDAESAMDLVSRCSSTLESLRVDFHSAGPPRAPPQLDLSKARRLKDIEFRFESPNVQWIVATLQTARVKHLRQITIFSSATTSAIEEMDRRGWQSLDNLLVRLWASYSVTPAIKYQRGKDLGELASSLLPELTEKGIIGEVGEDWRPEW